jgi:hypothetical protein
MDLLGEIEVSNNSFKSPFIDAVAPSNLSSEIDATRASPSGSALVVAQVQITNSNPEKEKSCRIKNNTDEEVIQGTA